VLANLRIFFLSAKNIFQKKVFFGFLAGFMASTPQE